MVDKQYISNKPLRRVSHLHLSTPITGVVLSDAWAKLALDTTNFMIRIMNGFTFDDPSDRIYWDASGAVNDSIQATFIGDAGLEVTSGIGAGVTISLGLFVNDVLILETPLTFDVVDRIQG